MSDPMQEFTPERWAIVKDIISGEYGDRVSLNAAAKQAGITLATLKGWIRRSEKALPEDDPIIHEIAPFVAESGQLQGDVLEDVMWQRAVDGVNHPVVHKGIITDTYKKYDNRLLERLIAVRKEQYQPRTVHERRIRLDASDIYARLLAGQRLAEAEAEREGRTIDLDPTEFQEVINEPVLPAKFVTPDPTEDPLDF